MRSFNQTKNQTNCRVKSGSACRWLDATESDLHVFSVMGKLPRRCLGLAGWSELKEEEEVLVLVSAKEGFTTALFWTSFAKGDCTYIVLSPNTIVCTAIAIKERSKGHTARDKVLGRYLCRFSSEIFSCPGMHGNWTPKGGSINRDIWEVNRKGELKHSLASLGSVWETFSDIWMMRNLVSGTASRWGIGVLYIRARIWQRSDEYGLEDNKDPENLSYNSYRFQVSNDSHRRSYRRFLGNIATTLSDYENSQPWLPRARALPLMTRAITRASRAPHSTTTTISSHTKPSTLRF
jgi:hypothetical protein